MKMALARIIEGRDLERVDGRACVAILATPLIGTDAQETPEMVLSV
jgi:hypothetical protein